MVRTGRSMRYRLPRPISLAFQARAGAPTASFRLEVVPPLSRPGAEIREYVRQPPAARDPVGYDRAFFDSYRPNETFYLSQADRERLPRRGAAGDRRPAAGTHARQILNRLLIDLSWNSSRLEGNTYSLLDTTRLLEIGEEAEGKQRLEAQMI